jgi:hypothetical protein
MPNHLHLLLNLNGSQRSLNQIVGNGKRLLAYHIVARLIQQNEQKILAHLTKTLTKKQIAKGQKHRVFIPSFDVQVVHSNAAIQEILDYMHLNPVKGKWHLAEDYRKYPHSSAGFYERNETNVFTTKYQFY